MTRRLAVIGFLFVPAVAFAQRSGGRTQADRKTDLFEKQEMPKGPTLRVRDIEDQSPLKLLIDKRKDLKLSDAQVTQLKETETKLKDTNAPLFKSADSLLREMKQAGNSPNDQARVRTRDARTGLTDVLKDLRASYDTPVKDLLAQLDAEQQSKAKELLEKQREEGDKMLRERLGGGGERP